MSHRERRSGSVLSNGYFSRAEPGEFRVEYLILRTDPERPISEVGLLGGSAIPAPGEVSLAHHGVLFLDELPEFKRSTLEVMRQPLEDGKVTVSRAAGSVTFPSEFMLVAAMNPCPCGYFGDLKRECRCGPLQVQRYRQRISGPLLDRIDLHIEVPAVEYRDIASTKVEESSVPMSEFVLTRLQFFLRIASCPRPDTQFVVFFFYSS